MKKYDFIRFGGCVQWVNDSEGTCLTMQVCTPPYPLMIIQKLLSFYQTLMTLLMKQVNHTLLMQAN